MNIISPITITDAMIGAGTTVAEPSATETAWSNASVPYIVGDVRIRATTHRKYRCAAAHTSAASPLPENDPTRWVDIGPTDRWAPFDYYASTQATGITSISYVLQPGYVNALALYGLTGTQYSITVKDTPGGTVIDTRTGYLTDDPAGWYEYLFGAPRTVNKVVQTGLPIRPTAEITITITAATGQPVGIGMIVLGDYTSLVGEGDWGGTQYGAKAEPVTYSYIKTNTDGTTAIVRRHAATNMRVTIAMPRTEADAVLQAVQQVLDVPVAWVATSAAGYRGLNVFGLGSGSMSYDSFGIATLEINVKGMI
jgi:hypothetical protein